MERNSQSSCPFCGLLLTSRKNPAGSFGGGCSPRPHLLHQGNGTEISSAAFWTSLTPPKQLWMLPSGSVQRWDQPGCYHVVSSPILPQLPFSPVSLALTPLHTRSIATQRPRNLCKDAGKQPWNIMEKCCWNSASVHPCWIEMDTEFRVK